MPRTLPEWVGKTPDTKIPPRVRLRVWERDRGSCRNCNRKIGAGDKWGLDHDMPLILGGEHRESNLRVLCDWCHYAKSTLEVAVKSKVYRIRAKHTGIKRKKNLLPGSKGSGIRRRMSGQVWRE